MFTQSIQIEASQTLSTGTVPAARYAAGANTSANLPADTTVIVYPTVGNSGTYLGSLTKASTTQAPGIAGSGYTLTSNAAGAISVINITTNRPNATPSPIVTALVAPLNPGAGPNMGFAAQTIKFDTASIIEAFGVQDPVITGTVTVTLVAEDFQAPVSGAVATGPPVTEQIYEVDPSIAGAKSFDVFIGVAGNIRIEMIDAPVGQFVILTAPVGVLNVKARKIYLGAVTTASGILALY